MTMRRGCCGGWAKIRRALADLLERMDKKMCGKESCGPSWLGSHPATALRAARLRQHR